MNSSWSESVNGECNTTPQGLYRFELNVVDKAVDAIRRRSTRKKLQGWRKKSINTNGKIYQEVWE